MKQYCLLALLCLGLAACSPKPLSFPQDSASNASTSTGLGSGTPTSPTMPNISPNTVSPTATPINSSTTPTSPTSTSPQDNFVGILYNGLLARAPDAAGAAYWDNLILSASAPSCAQLAGDFLTSAEFQSDISKLNTNDYVKRLYYGLLNRAPDLDGFVAWVNAINSGGVSRGAAAQSFLQSPEFQSDCQNQYGFLSGAGTIPSLSF